MKKLLILTAVVMVLLSSSISARTIHKNDISINYFYSALEPHGEWIEIGYDDYIWRPYKSDYNWRPYSDGRWEWTRNGWYWVSYEPFGWATYHYGRWYQDDYYGWVWMPDNVWAPSWVEWRYNEYYIGWAPLPPYARFNRRSGIYFSINWHSGHSYWNFVKYNHFASHNIYNYCVDRHYVKNVFSKTKRRTNYFADNNRIVNGGISRKYVERKIGKKFITRKISRTDNYKEYTKRVKKSRKSIVDFRPNERLTKGATLDRTKVRKGRALKSLKTDKIAINRKKVDKKNSNFLERKKNVRKTENKNGKIIEKTSRSNRVYNKPIRNKDARKLNKKSTNKRLEKESSYSVEKKSRSKVSKNNNKSRKVVKKSSSRRSSENKRNSKLNKSKNRK